MGDLVFTLGADTMTWSQGRAYPIADPARVNVLVDYSAGRQLYAYDKGVEELEFRLRFVNCPQSDVDAFVDWLTNVAVGPVNAFTFTDESATDHTVRLMTMENPFQEMDNGVFTGTVVLRKEVA